MFGGFERIRIYFHFVECIQQVWLIVRIVFFFMLNPSQQENLRSHHIRSLQHRLIIETKKRRSVAVFHNLFEKSFFRLQSFCVFVLFFSLFFGQFSICLYACVICQMHAVCTIYSISVLLNCLRTRRENYGSEHERLLNMYWKQRTTMTAAAAATTAAR